MKKILSVLIAVLLMCSCLLVPVSAQEDKLLQDFLVYCHKKLGEGNTSEVRITDRINWDDVTYFSATSWLAPAQEGTCEIIGEYCVHSNVTEYPYALGVYVATNDEVYSYKDAFDLGVIKSASMVTAFDGITAHKAGEDVELTHRCMDAFARYKKFTPEKDEYIECEVYGEVEDAVVFRAEITNKGAMYPCICSQQRIGGYVFTYGYVIGPDDNPTGLYILKDGKVMSAIDAYENRDISINGLLSVVGSEEDPYNIRGKVAEKLGYPVKGHLDWEPPYLYREQYAYYSSPSPVSAYDLDYALVFAVDGPGAPAAPVDVYGNYVVGSYEWYSDYRHGYYIYVPETDTLYTLEEAVEANVEGIENAFLHLGKQGGIRGDADKDGTITVKDATFIQKKLAGIKVPMLYNDNLWGVIEDFDADTHITVKDATAIQKFVAGIEFSKDDV